MPDFNPIKRTNELRIQSVFISAVLNDTAKLIYAKQNQVAEEWDLFEHHGTGRLKQSLQGYFSVASSEGSGRLSMRYLTYARWLDMQDNRRKMKKEGYHLYNRIVFGVLYNPTFNALMYGLTDDVREFLGSRLEEALAQKMPYYKITDTVLKQVSEYDRNYAAILSKSLRQGYR